MPWSVQAYTWRQQNANVNYTWTLSPNLVNQAWLRLTRYFGGPHEPAGDVAARSGLRFHAARALRDCRKSPSRATSRWASRSPVRWRATIFTTSVTWPATHTGAIPSVSAATSRWPRISRPRCSTTTEPSASPARRPVPRPTRVSFRGLPAGPAGHHEPGCAGGCAVQLLAGGAVCAGRFQDPSAPDLESRDCVTTSRRRRPTRRTAKRRWCRASSPRPFPSSPLGVLVVGDPGVTRGVVPIRWGHISPRVGLAWDPLATARPRFAPAREFSTAAFRATGGERWRTHSHSRCAQQFSNVGFVDPSLRATCRAASLRIPYVYSPSTARFITPAGLLPIALNFQWPYSYQLNFTVQRADCQRPEPVGRLRGHPEPPPGVLSGRELSRSTTAPRPVPITTTAGLTMWVCFPPST